MITSIYNNLNIAQVTFKDYQTPTLTVLNAHFTAAPVTSSWRAAKEIVFEFPELQMNKSGISAVYLITNRVNDRARRGTILRSWIRNNRLHIEKIDAFNDYGPLHFYVCTAYAQGGQRRQVIKDGYVTTGITGQPSGTQLDKKCLVVKPNYVFCQLTFRSFKTDSGSQQSFRITGMPSDVDALLPVVYANPYVRTIGAPLSEGHLQNGVLTCTNPDDSSYMSNAGTFLQFFAVRDTESNQQ